jgi:hypothetical protein
MEAFDIVQWPLEIAMFLSLILFIYYTYSYIRMFGNTKDPYTIACFVFLILSLISRVFLRGACMLIAAIYYKTSLFQLLVANTDDGVIHTILAFSYLASRVIPHWFFDIAIEINVIRWCYVLS